MSSSSKTPAADRSQGGPGSSRQDASKPKSAERRGPAPDEPTNPPTSRVSGGGGERDRHHTHDPKTKRDRAKRSRLSDANGRATVSSRPQRRDQDAGG